MRQHGILRWSAMLGLVMLLAGFLFAQNAPNRSLVVNGKTAAAPVLQLNGRTYVELESLAQALNAAVSFEATRVVLTIPGANAPESAAAPVAPQTPAEPPPVAAPPGITRAFASAAIADLAEMREWRGATTAVISYGIPVTGTWPQDYHDHVESTLRQAMIAAATDDDQNSLQLLQNEFSNLDAWAGNVIAMRQALNAAPSVDPNALQNDAVFAKISKCGNFLGGMIVSGSFSDDASCH